MPMYGPTLPEDVMPQSDFFGRGLEVSRWKAAELSATEAAGSWIGATANAVQKAYYENFHPGKTLSPEEWKKSDYYREGMKVASPIGANVAQFEAEVHDNSVALANVEAAAPAGFLSGATKFGAGLVGSFLNPIILTGFMGSEYFIGKGTAKLLNTLNESQEAARTAALVAHGAGVGIGGLLPEVALRFRSAEYLDQNPSGLAAIATLLLGAGLGGALHGLGVVKNPFFADDFLAAREVGIRQVAAGKTPHVDEILQNGYRRARLNEPDIDVPRETLFKEEAKLREEHQELAGKVDEAKKVVDQASEEKLGLSREKQLKALGGKIEDYRDLSEKDVALRKHNQINEEYKGKGKELENIKAMRAMDIDKGKTVNINDLKQASEKMNSYAGDQTMNVADQAKLNEEVKASAKSNDEDLIKKENIVDRLKAADALNKDHLESLDKIKRIRGSFDEISNLIKKAADCLKEHD